MKLISAKFNNYRLLRNLNLNFSTDDSKPLTVIRASNETGKTTILHALQWALFGEGVLPSPVSEYRFSPLDSRNGKVEISVEIEFSIESTIETSVTTEIYKIRRTVVEDVIDTKFKSRKSIFGLFRVGSDGAEPIDAEDSENLMNNFFPKARSETFFTDGDRTLKFIEVSETEQKKRKRVHNAVRSLLDIELIEDVIKHVNNVLNSRNRESKKNGEESNFSNITSSIADLEQEIASESARIQSLTEEQNKIEEKIEKIEIKIKRFAGINRPDLEKRLIHIDEQLTKLKERRLTLAKDHSELFTDIGVVLLAKKLLSDSLNKSYERLEKLNQEGEFPKASVFVLTELLNSGICVCGESLVGLDKKVAEKIHMIKSKIAESEKLDEEQKMLSALFSGASGSLGIGINYETTVGIEKEDDITKNHWPALYENIVKTKVQLDEDLNQYSREKKTIIKQLEEIPNSDINEVNKMKRIYTNQRDDCITEIAVLENTIIKQKEDLTILTDKRDNVEKHNRKSREIYAHIKATEDIREILLRVKDKITNNELAKVSESMSKIFIKMIGGDHEGGSTIKSAKIDSEFNIIVYGENERTLSPDFDLNGASRRALTLAFIFALTRISGVVAPNVIDTPLGMMDGFVKNSVLSTAIEESSQLILLLQRAEIAGCETIINSKAGKIITLTNSTHFPKMLKNKPNTDAGCILRCECQTLGECSVCSRHDALEDIGYD